LRVRANKGCHWVDGGAQRGMRNMFACLYTPLCRMRVLLCCAVPAVRRVLCMLTSVAHVSGSVACRRRMLH
jgi:hypothetical protein